MPLGPCAQRSCIGGRKLLILGVADVRLHLLVRIAGHAMGCSRPMNATAANCVHTVRPSAAADSRVLNTPKTICFSHLVALRSAARTRLHTDMVDYGRPEVLLSTLLVLNLRKLTATSGYQVRARCRSSGWAPNLHWRCYNLALAAMIFCASLLPVSGIPAISQLFSELPFHS